MILIATLATAEVSAGALAKADQKKINLHRSLSLIEILRTPKFSETQINRREQNWLMILRRWQVHILTTIFEDARQSKALIDSKQFIS